MIKTYLATTLDNAEQGKRIRRLLGLAGCVLTYDWLQHGSVQKDGPERIREVAEAEAKGVMEADAVLVALPGKRGSHVELGIAIGSSLARDAGSKPAIVVWAPDGDSILDDKGRECAFYRHPDISLVVDPDPEAAIEQLVKGTRMQVVRSIR